MTNDDSLMDMEVSDFMCMLLMYVCQLLFLCPDGLSHFSFYRYVRILQNISLIITIVVLLLSQIECHFLKAVCAFYIVIALSTLRVTHVIDSILLFASRGLGSTTLYLLCARYDYKKFWEYASNYFIAVTTVNTSLSIVKPSGLIISASENGARIHYHLLGNTNQVIPFYIIAITVCIIRYHVCGCRKALPLFVYVQGVITAIICDSSTSIVMLFVYGCLYYVLYTKREPNDRMENLAIITLVAVASGYYGLVVLRIQTMFAFIIENILHKDVNLSTRTTIWDLALTQIKYSPIIGYGANLRRYLRFGKRSFDAHNLILQLLLMGGYSLFFSLIALIVLAFLNWSKSDQSFKVVALILFITFSIGSCTEVYLITYVTLIPTIIYIIGDCTESVNP